MNEKEWDDYVDNHPKGTFFHKMGWKKVIENVFGFKAIYMIAKAGDKVRGVLPLFEINQTSGKKIISVPFSTEGGVLFDDEKARDYLINNAKEIAKEDDVNYLELRQEDNIDVDNFSTKDYYFHMKLDLCFDSEKVWMNADKKMRNAVRKAESLGLSTDRGTHYFEDFYRIFSRNMRDLGTPVDKKEFFEEIFNKFPDDVDIIVGKRGEEVIGAIFLVKKGKVIKSEWASSLRKYFGWNVNQLIYWRAIEDACKEGFEIFDFGRSVEGEGTYMFKQKFGAKPVKLHYKYFTNKGDIPDTRKTNLKRRMFSSVWKNMPLFIANKIGPKLREEFP